MKTTTQYPLHHSWHIFAPFYLCYIDNVCFFCTLYGIAFRKVLWNIPNDILFLCLTYASCVSRKKRASKKKSHFLHKGTNTNHFRKNEIMKRSERVQEKWRTIIKHPCLFSLLNAHKICGQYSKKKKKKITGNSTESSSIIIRKMHTTTNSVFTL